MEHQAVRVVLVTGANGSLGQATARAFLDESAANQLWLGVHENRSRAEALASEFAGRCRILGLDVTHPAAWTQGVEQILAVHQRLDVLVNNAGGHEDMLLAALPLAAWRRILSLNLDAVYFGCQAVMRPMIAQRSGRIVNVSSLSAWMAPAGQTNYAAAKAGVLALTQSLAKEVARLGITVNAVCPGFIDTEALAGVEGEPRRAMLERIPMRRLGRPEEVAAAIRFLACPEAGYITGSALKIDGGIF
jgi:3-oxoacyl-[acyl-carrier protein] reductase